MKKEETLLRAIGSIDEKMIQDAAAPKKMIRDAAAPKKPRRTGPLVKWCAAAACLCILLGASIAGKLWTPTYTDETPKQSEGLFSDAQDSTKNAGTTEDTGIMEDAGTTEDAGITENAGTTEDAAHSYVDIEQLLPKGDVISDQALIFTMVPINGRIAEYHRIFKEVDSDGASRLPKSLGVPLEGDKNYYRLLGHEEMQYLILREEDGYSLWKFSHFLVWDQEEFAAVKEGLADGTSAWSDFSWFSLDMDFSPYSYDMILRDIYGVTSGEAIESILVEPANMDNTDAGKKLQEEIGTRTITEKSQIAAIYQAISALTCLGSDNWESIGLNVGDNLPEQVRCGRYLTISLKNGGIIDSLKYTGISGQFYEYSGIAYKPLAEDTAREIEALLGIQGQDAAFQR